MPIMQQSYWLDFVTRAAHPKDYLGKVSPGRRPWEWGALRLLHVLLVDVFFAVYAVALVPFLPLAVCFGVPILLLLLAIVFGAMYAPVQILNGKWPLCCCGAFRCCRSRFPRLFRTVDTLATSAHADQLDLLMLKALAVVFFALGGMSVYFAPVYYGHGGTYLQALAPMFALPSWSFRFWPDWRQMAVTLEWLRGLDWEFRLPVLSQVSLTSVQLLSSRSGGGSKLAGMRSAACSCVPGGQGLMTSVKACADALLLRPAYWLSKHPLVNVGVSDASARWVLMPHRAVMWLGETMFAACLLLSDALCWGWLACCRGCAAVCARRSRGRRAGAAAAAAEAPPEDGDGAWQVLRVSELSSMPLGRLGGRDKYPRNRHRRTHDP